LETVRHSSHFLLFGDRYALNKTGEFLDAMKLSTHRFDLHRNNVVIQRVLDGRDVAITASANEADNGIRTDSSHGS
jgi:hypothetical protein